MGVPEGKRKESKIEFERAYDRIYDDCFELIRINFGGEKELVETYSEQIKQISEKLMQAVCDIGMYIKIAKLLNYQLCKKLLESEEGLRNLENYMI